MALTIARGQGFDWQASSQPVTPPRSQPGGSSIPVRPPLRFHEIIRAKFIREFRGKMFCTIGPGQSRARHHPLQRRIHAPRLRSLSQHKNAKSYAPVRVNNMSESCA
jgi:hypothetical protein